MPPIVWRSRNSSSFISFKLKVRYFECPYDCHSWHKHLLHLHIRRDRQVIVWTLPEEEHFYRCSKGRTSPNTVTILLKCPMGSLPSQIYSYNITDQEGCCPQKRWLCSGKLSIQLSLLWEAQISGGFLVVSSCWTCHKNSWLLSLLIFFGWDFRVYIIYGCLRLSEWHFWLFSIFMVVK